MKLADFAVQSRTSAFRGRLERARRCIAESAGATGPVCVFFSGGKDSTVILDLAVDVLGAARVRVGFFDYGDHLTPTYRMLDAAEAHHGIHIERLQTEPDFLTCLRRGGYWGYRGPETDLALEFDFRRIMIDGPAERFRAAVQPACCIVGLRAEESPGRQARSAVYGEIHAMRSGEVRVCPLSWWRIEDVWAYIVTRGLPYHAAYDVLTEHGVPFKAQRVDNFFGTDAMTIGRFVYWKLVDPETFTRFAGEFPGVREAA